MNATASSVQNEVGLKSTFTLLLISINLTEESVFLTCSGYIDVPKYRYSVMHLIVSKSF